MHSSAIRGMEERVRRHQDENRTARPGLSPPLHCGDRERIPPVSTQKHYSEVEDQDPRAGPKTDERPEICRAGEVPVTDSRTTNLHSVARSAIHCQCVPTAIFKTRWFSYWTPMQQPLCGGAIAVVPRVSSVVV